MASDEAFLRACDAVYKGRMREGLPSLLARLTEFPEPFVQRRLLAKLRAVATETGVAEAPLFFRRDKRPQLCEALEAPLTSIYASRIACWTFFDHPLRSDDPADGELFHPRSGPPASQPVLFAITGHGPAPVCARVSAIIHDLACERNSPSDVILAGACFLDLTCEPQGDSQCSDWSPEEIQRQVREHAESLGIEEIFDVAPDEWQGFLEAFRSRMSRPAVDTAREALAHVGAEMGFVVNVDRNAATYRRVVLDLGRGRVTGTTESFPVLVEARCASGPLRVRLPMACLGLADYDRLVREYRRAVHREMRQEWERRQSKYEEWSQQFAHSYRRLRAEMHRGGMEALAQRPVYIHYGIDTDTATETRYDPPRQITELEYLAELPMMTIDQLAYWAWADHKIHRMPASQSFRPHWERSCLMDAFLRGWPLPTEDERVNAAREDWTSTWRPLALLALQAGLEKQGLSLANVAAENTVFRIVAEDQQNLTFGLYHVWDPFLDPPPACHPGRPLFASAFGGRRRTCVPARVAQVHATSAVQEFLQAGLVDADRLRQALCLDSGEALDLLHARLCQPFVKSGLPRDLELAMSKALQKIDPLVSFGVWERFRRCRALPELASLARECGAAGQEGESAASFFAWELYLVGEILQSAITNVLKAADSGSLPPELDGRTLKTIKDWTPWQLLHGFLAGPLTSTFEAVLHLFGLPVALQGLQHSRRRLHEIDTDYEEACFAGEGPPPPRPEDQRRYAPHCLKGWERICYDIAEGDAAMALAWGIREGGSLPEHDVLVDIAAKIRKLSIPQVFRELTAQRQQLLEDLQQKLVHRDPVSLEKAAAAVRRALADGRNQPCAT